jgi:hypothetical protein
LEWILANWSTGFNPGKRRFGRDAALRRPDDDSASDLSKQAEREYRDRDVTMPKVTQALRDARDTLLVANRENPKALGDFGFVIDDSPQDKSQSQTRALKPAPV